MSGKSRLAVYLCMAGLAAGCWSKPPQVARTTPEELHRQWLQLADASVQDMDIATAQEIGSQLNEAGRLDLILGTLGDASANPKSKLLAVVSLLPFVGPEMFPTLETYVGLDKEATTRACAAKLIGLIATDAARACLESLMQDTEHRVRVTATLMLARDGLPEAVTKLRELWTAPDTTASEKTELVLSIPETQLGLFQDILLTAAVNQELDQDSRARAITALGQYGDNTALAVLENSAANDPIPALRQMAAESLAALRERVAHAGTEPQSGTPADSSEVK